MNPTTIAFFCLLSSGQEADTDTLKSIASQYESNRTSLQRGQFTFHQVEGFAQDIDQAVAGKLDRVWYEMDGVLAFDRGRVRYDHVLLDGKAVVKDGGRHPDLGLKTVVTPAMSSRIVFDGRFTIQDMIFHGPDSDEVQHAPIRTAGPEALVGACRFPLGLGPPTPSSDGLQTAIERALEGHKGASVQPLQPKDIEKAKASGCTVLRLGGADGDRVYTVDRKRGAIPIRMDWEGDKAAGTWKVLDQITQVGPAFVPMRSITFRGQNGRTTIITVTSHSTERPAEDQFLLTFDTPVPLRDEVEHAQYSSRDRWSANDLPRRGSKQFFPLSTKPPAPSSTPPPAMPGEREPWPTWVMVVIVVIGSSVMATILLLWRRRDGQAA